MPQSEQRTCVYVPGSHILQHWPFCTYWVSGSQRGWAAAITCTMIIKYECDTVGGSWALLPLRCWWGFSGVTVASLPQTRLRGAESPKHSTSCSLWKPRAARCTRFFLFSFLLLIVLFCLTRFRQRHVFSPQPCFNAAAWKTKVKVIYNRCIIGCNLK